MKNIKYGREIGRDSASKRNRKFIWQACIDCGKERWVLLTKGEPVAIRCVSCACTKTHWKDGRSITQGYILLRIERDDFFYPTANRRYILEHRLVMAKHLGRNLQPWEIIHHKNANRRDNRIENLQLVIRGRHVGKINCPHCHKELFIY